jgi:hypothetical protein
MGNGQGSAGVTLREYEIVGPVGTPPPAGIPAGIVGTAQRGPAFVPVTVGSNSAFGLKFGATDERFGPLAVNEWMTNSGGRAATYLRVLGSGECNERDSVSGVVDGAGFIVGSELPSGVLGALDVNPFTVLTDIPAVPASASILVTSAPTGYDDNEGFTYFDKDGNKGKIILSNFDDTAGNHTDPATDGDGYWLVAVPLIHVDAGQEFTLTKQQLGERLADAINDNTVNVGVTASYNNGVLTLTQGSGGLLLSGRRVIAPVESTGKPECLTLGNFSSGADAVPVGVNPEGRTYFLGGLMDDSSGSNLLSSAGLVPAWEHVGASNEEGVWCRYGLDGDLENPVSGGTAFNTSKVYNLYRKTFKYVSTRDSAELSGLSAANGDTILAIKAVLNPGQDIDHITQPLIKFDLGSIDQLMPGILSDGSASLNGVGSLTSSDGLGNLLIRSESPTTLKVAHYGANSSTVTTNAFPMSGSPIKVSRPTSQKKEIIFWINKSKFSSDVLSIAGSAWTNGAPNAAVFAKFKDVTKCIFVPSDFAPSGGTLDVKSLSETFLTLDTVNQIAIPIVRGVLMAPSGVMLQLKTGDDLSTTGDVTQAGEFYLQLTGYSGSSGVNTVLTASFDLLNDAYFPNVFNTDPLRIQEAGHYLYAHWDVHPDLASTVGDAFLYTGSEERNDGSSAVPNFEDFRDRFSHAVSPWVISQEFGGTVENLFRFHALDDGAGASTRFKFSIENLVPGKPGLGGGFGSFDLLVRSWEDTDANPVVLESFKGLSLDPKSDKYVARVIGNSYRYFDFDRPEGEQKLIDVIDHPVGSNFIRVEMSDKVDNEEISPDALPMGFRGIDHLNTLGTLSGAGGYSPSIVTPPVPMRLNVAIGSGLGKKANSALYWGAQFEHITDLDRVNVPPRGNNFKDASLASFAKFFPSHRLNVANFLTSKDADTYCNNKFTLENVYVVQKDNVANPKEWENAVYSRDGSAVSGKHRLKLADLENAKNRRYGKFTFFMQGGFDGVNIFNEDMAKLTNKAVSEEIHNENRGRIDKGPTARAYVKAIEIMKNTVNGDLQLFAMPGIRNSSITELASDAVRDRFDALYLMDIEQKSALDDGAGNLLEVSERDQDFLEGRKVSVSNTVAAFEERDMDNSFAAAYFPDVVVTDPGTGAAVTVPPSVVVLGAMALNDRVGHPWFAPAGVTRGALGSTIRTKVTLSKANLDALYDAGINPLTPPVAGQPVTVWGQKTLQAGDSALNRVNVRRLLIEIRRQVRDIAQSIIFEPNRASTLARFTAAVTPRLQRIQSLAGLERFRVVIDSSTTTQTDIENNTVRGKIYVQPTKSIEFVSIDFVVTNNAGEQV